MKLLGKIGFSTWLGYVCLGIIMDGHSWKYLEGFANLSKKPVVAYPNPNCLDMFF